MEKASVEASRFLPKSPRKWIRSRRDSASVRTVFLVELIEQGIEVRRQKERAFFELAERFRAASDPEQVNRLGDELGRFVFGE